MQLDEEVRLKALDEARTAKLMAQELQVQLKEMGKSNIGARNVLIKRYEMYSPDSVSCPGAGSERHPCV